MMDYWYETDAAVADVSVIVLIGCVDVGMA
jgi:hypothetical protein